MAAPRSYRAIFLRLAFENDGEEHAWLVDEAEQRVELAAPADRAQGGKLVLYATTPTRTRPPVVTIGPQRVTAIDLLFELPQSFKGPNDLVAFDFVYTVREDARTFSQRIPFERRELAPRVLPSAPAYEPLPLPLERRIPSRTAPERSPVVPFPDPQQGR